MNYEWFKMTEKIEKLTIKNKNCKKCGIYRTSACLKTFGLFLFPKDWNIKKNSCSGYKKRYYKIKSER